MRTDEPVTALQRSYEAGVTDEFIKPIVVTTGNGASAAPVGLIRDDDAVIFFNFRADRARQMKFALVAPDFDKFADAKRPKNLFYVGMTQYDKNWPWLKYVIAPEKLEHILAQVFAELQYKNLRTAETEKYAHVTYFFNGGVEKPFAGEERILGPSPKGATYDLKPEMSAAGIRDTGGKAVARVGAHCGRRGPRICREGICASVHNVTRSRTTPAETKLVICVWHPFTEWRPKPAMAEAIRKRWPEMRVLHLPNYDRLAEELPDTDIFVGYSLRADQLKHAKKLQWIHSPPPDCNP